MNAIVFSGKLGAGKTLGMAILALYYASRSGCTLYSNCGINFSKPFSHYEDFLDIAEQKHSIVCLDESHVDLDSRSSNANTVKHFTNLLFYLRKLRCTMFFTTPSIDNLDLRVRDIMNIYCEVSKDKKYFRYNLYDLQSEIWLKEIRIKKESAFALSEKIYDTNAMVTPLELPQETAAFKNFLHQLKIKNAEFGIAKDEEAGPSTLPLGDKAELHDNLLIGV